MDRGILNKSTTTDFEPVSGFALTSICGMINQGFSVYPFSFSDESRGRFSL